MMKEQRLRRARKSLILNIIIPIEEYKVIKERCGMIGNDTIKISRRSNEVDIIISNQQLGLR